jgi:hypothetical protein
MYEYTLVINSEMSVSVSAFPGMLNVAHLKKKHAFFQKIGSHRHVYWNPTSLPMYVFVYRRRNAKNIFKHLYKYETFFYLEAILLTCRWSYQNKPAQIFLYEAHDNF